MTVPDDVMAQLSIRNTALLLVDLQRRHLDVGGVGYHVLPAGDAARVSERAGSALLAARSHGLPVVHVGTWARLPPPWGAREVANPFWRWQDGKPIAGAAFVRQARKCVAGTEYAEFMPQVMPRPDEPVVVKSRYSSFYMTDLEEVLRSLRIENLVISGVNTNNCVMHTSFDAHARDFRVIVLEDACGSMNGSDYHQLGLRQIGASIGWLATVDEFVDALRTAGSLTVAARDCDA